MPVALRWAFAFSLLIHAGVLFWLEPGLDAESPPLILTAELRPMPKVDATPARAAVHQAEPEAVAPTPRPKRVAKRTPPHQPAAAVRPASPEAVAPAMTTPLADAAGTAAPDNPPREASRDVASEVPTEPMVPMPTTEAAIRDFPAQGRIVYRVDRGDAGFQIGISRQEWQIADGAYRLHSVSETVGLAWLVRSVKQEAESRGKMTAHGFVPESYAVLRNGRETSEKAIFDWENRGVEVGKRGRVSLEPGAQDFLTFAYQLGFADPSASGTSMPIATGKKYGVYRLENLGDEEIAIPLGKLRTAHFRVAGIDAELWLAYEYSLLPVKIRFIDNKGDTYVQVATTIELGQP